MFDYSSDMLNFNLISLMIHEYFIFSSLYSQHHLRFSTLSNSTHIFILLCINIKSKVLDLIDTKTVGYHVEIKWKQNKIYHIANCETFKIQ